MKTRLAVPADPYTIEAVKAYLGRAFPHCRIEAFWTADPIEYTFVAYDLRNRPTCNVIIERELFETYGPGSLPRTLDELGLADSLRDRTASQVRVTKRGEVAYQSV